MRRWLLALFVLQFFCSVSAFTYASTDTFDNASPTAGVTMDASTGSQDLTPKGAASALDPVHGLLDEIPELPECLDVTLGDTTRFASWDIPRDHPIAGWTPPALDGPQRPPRSLPALA